MSMVSTFSRSNFHNVLSRRSNVPLLNDDSWNAGIRNTFFSSLRLANRSPPVGDLSPTYSLRKSLSPAALKSISIRGVASP
jgi:hypothetical protein